MLATQHLALVACMLGAITACSATSPTTGTVAARAEPAAFAPGAAPDSVEELLRYGERLGALPPQALNQEYVQAARALAGDASAANRVRVALLVSRPGTSFRDDKRARSLLREVTNDPRYNARKYQGLASFLLLALDDRERVEAALAEERRQHQELQHKLEQLKAIEQDFSRRIPNEPIKGK